MLRIVTIAYLIAAAMVLGATAATAATCSADSISAAATKLEAARRMLLALPIGDGLQTGVSPQGRKAIAATKRRIDSLVAAYMRCASGEVGAATVQSDLDRLGHARVLQSRIYKVGELPPDVGKYGYRLHFEAKRAARGLIAIVARFDIECGEDATLMIFERQDESWSQVLRAQSKPYDTVGGGWWVFDYAISPPDAAGHWFVVVKSVAPWCSSTWSAIDYSVLRPSGRAASPAILFHREDDIWWGADRYGDLKVGVADFDLRFRSFSIDTGVHNREWIRHYSVVGDVVRRTPPLAEFPRDFADEWIVSSWKEAGEWSSPAALARLRRMHDEVYKIHFFDYGAFHGCSDAPDHFQIEARISDPANGEGSYYFQVKGCGGYRMLDVSRRPDPKCDKPDTVDP